MTKKQIYRYLLSVFTNDSGFAGIGWVFDDPVIWQKRPYTAVRITGTRISDPVDVVTLGFSKVSLPDKYDPAFGVDLATRKALSQMAKEIHKRGV